MSATEALNPQNQPDDSSDYLKITDQFFPDLLPFEPPERIFQRAGDPFADNDLDSVSSGTKQAI